MYSLIVKDILIQKKRLLVCLLIIILMIFSFQNIGAAMFTACAGAFTYSLVMTACAYEDMNKSDIMINSLPVKKSEIVGARYVSIFIFFIIGSVVYYLCYVITGITRIPLKVYPLSPELLMGGLVSVSLIHGIYLPVFFKVGYVKSKMLNFIIFFGFFYGVSSLIAVIQHKTDLPLIKQLIEFVQSRGQIFLLMIMLGFVAVFMYASYLLSVRFYKQREF